MEKLIKSVRTLSVALMIVLCFASLSVAAVIETGEYRPAVVVLPDTAVNTWTQWGGAASTKAFIVPNALYIDTLQDVTVGLGYSRTNSAQHASDTITVVARVKVLQYSGADPAATAIFWADDATSNVLSILPGGLQLYYPYMAGAAYSMNTTDDYHTYKIVASGPNNSVKVYVDGNAVPVIDTVIPSDQGYDRSWVMFGDGTSGAGALSAWEFVRYRVDR
jgi:hypothetical protein